MKGGAEGGEDGGGEGDHDGGARATAGTMESAESRLSNLFGLEGYALR